MAKRKMPSGGIWDQPLAPGGVPGVTPGPSTTATQDPRQGRIKSAKAEWKQVGVQNDAYAKWLESIGVSPSEYAAMASQKKHDLSLGYGGEWPSTVPEALQTYLKGLGLSPRKWWDMTQAQRNEYRASYNVKQTESQAAQGALDALALGAEALTEPGFFEFVPPVFMPATDRFASATMDAWAQGVLGRRLRPDERERMMKLWRSNERKLYSSEVKRQRAEHARGVLGTAEPFGGGKEQDPAALAQIGVQVPDAGVEKEAKSRTKPFTFFSEEDFQLAMQEAAALLSPREEMGVELREAFGGFAQAIKGRVSQEMFSP